jgi:hypothetical protein
MFGYRQKTYQTYNEIVGGAVSGKPTRFSNSSFLPAGKEIRAVNVSLPAAKPEPVSMWHACHLPFVVISARMIRAKHLSL